MNKISRIKYLFLVLGIALSVNVSAQNMARLLIEKMENCGLVIPEQCTPDDMIIIINSSIPNLRFESNMLPDSAFKVLYYAQSNQYIICHQRIKFLLTVSGPNLLSGDIEFFNTNIQQSCYRISANTTTGTVNIITNPSNATVIFRELRDQVFSTDKPITQVSGNYQVNIVKPKYKSVDTVIVIPSDAERTYKIDFVPLFSRIKIDLSTSDKSPFIKTPVLWVDSTAIELKNPEKFSEGVEFLKFYEGNIVPLDSGRHVVKIEAQGYIPFKTTITSQNQKMVNLSVSLEPIFGYITFIDKQLAEGANIIVDNENIGKIPLFRKKIRIGDHKVRFEKPGFVSVKDEYNVGVIENQNSDLDVIMVVAKKFAFRSEPANAEVLMDGSRIGFTPFSILINAGDHNLIVRKNGFASEKFKVMVNEYSPAEDSVRLKLRNIFPLEIKSEEDGLLVRMKGIGDVKAIDIDSTLKTPAVQQLPYGRYKISLLKGDKTLYRSSVSHSPDLKKWKLSVYSRTSFTVLSGNFTDKDNFEGSFGRIHLFPGSGLSTSILDFDYRATNIAVDSGAYKINYSFKTGAPYVLFLNWDWRMGGSILRQLDVNLLGRARYTPGLKAVALHLPQFDDVSMKSYFVGFEISSRISFFNINLRYGREINNGKVNYWDLTKGEYYPGDLNIKENRNRGSIGITIGGKVNKSNSMLRLWQKPLVEMIKWKAKNRENKK